MHPTDQISTACASASERKEREAKVRVRQVRQSRGEVIRSEPLLTACYKDKRKEQENKY